jgi:hypothetical protein
LKGDCFGIKPLAMTEWGQDLHPCGVRKPRLSLFITTSMGSLILRKEAEKGEKAKVKVKASSKRKTKRK